MSDSEQEEDPKEKLLRELPPIKIRHVDLPEHLWKEMMLLCCLALKEHTVEKDIAAYIKKELDAKPEFNELKGKGPWQCIVGRSFAGAITHETAYVCFFDVIPYQMTFIVFKSLPVQAEASSGAKKEGKGWATVRRASLTRRRSSCDIALDNLASFE